MSVSVKIKGNVALFKVIGDKEGINSTDLLFNLNDLQEIIKNNPQLHGQFNIDFHELKESATNEYFDEIFDIISKYFSCDFADVFVTGRFVDYEEEGLYHAVAEYEFKL